MCSKPSMQADKCVTVSGLTGAIMPCSGALQRTRALKRCGHLKRHAPTILGAGWLHLGHVDVEAQGARMCQVRATKQAMATVCHGHMETIKGRLKPPSHQHRHLLASISKA